MYELLCIGDMNHDLIVFRCVPINGQHGRKYMVDYILMLLKNGVALLLQCPFVDDRRVVPDERLMCYPTRNVSQVDGYLFRSVIQLVKQMCCLLPE